MTETTQETIKIARNLLKNGIEDKPSPVTVHALAKAVVELADETEALNYANASLGVKINGKKAKIKNLVSELAALKEKYRWRKQSEEPAPDDIIEIEIYDIGANVIFVPEGKVHIPGSRFWRPLGLPEE